MHRFTPTRSATAFPHGKLPTVKKKELLGSSSYTAQYESFNHFVPSPIVPFNQNDIIFHHHSAVNPSLLIVRVLAFFSTQQLRNEHTIPEVDSQTLQAAFEDALHMRYNSRVVPFLKGADLNPLLPYRIAAIPDVVLDIVVRSNHVCTEPALPLEKESETPPMSRQEQTAKTDISTINTTSTTRRNPVYGLENAAMENYSHIQRPPTVSPSARAPQSLSTTATLTSDNASQFQLVGNNHTLRAPQEISVTAGTGNLTHIMFGAVQGDAKSQVALRDMYREGRQVQQDYKAAMDWYSKAADEGSGAPQDFSQGLEWFSKAANQLDTNALYMIGALLEQGKYYLKAALKGHAPSQYKVGCSYSIGDCVPVDYLKAMEWLLKAANQGYADALDFIGVLLENGLGVLEDINNTIGWYEKAAGQGHAKAKEHLDRLKLKVYKIE
ncbi:HCP-like protein [Linnemannia elongata AG-77]|uniref:HCP-like protein n=1 Tax=Linnemannia elongata AG-77 TaxID=1314771 RepID=A0A197JY68_9FUNG|nr:HCP-like protein [Linnemannia elongata AG-77]